MENPVQMNFRKLLRTGRAWRYSNTRAALALSLFAFSQPALSDGILLWSDEFNTGGVPDTTVWSYDLGQNGWGNNELQEYTDNAENARIENGDLVITARKRDVGNGFTSARIRTQDKVTFRYGTIEARIRVPDLGDGLWPAFWTLGNNFPQVGWPACGELDILEMGNSSAISAGLVNRRVGSAAHWENNEQYATYGRYHDAPQRLDTDYHVYRMEWTPETVKTFVDGAKVWEMNIDPVNCGDCTEFHEPHFMILNLAVGGNYTGILGIDGITAPLPAEMRVDYVRVYDNGHTEMGGAALESPYINPAHSGSWYNDDQSGHGFSIEVGNGLGGSPLAVVYWYTYDTMGNPIFLTGQGEPNGTRVEIDFISPYGMLYGVFDKGTVERPDGGTGFFDFSDESNATFSYEPSEFSQLTWGHAPIESLPITKLFGIPVRGSD